MLADVGQKGLVIHEQDAFTAGGQGGRFFCIQRGPVLDNRDIHLKRAALPRFAACLYASVKAFDDSMHHRQAEPRAFACLLGRKVRIENVVDYIFINAGAGILNAQSDMVPRIQFGPLIRIIGA